MLRIKTFAGGAVALAAITASVTAAPAGAATADAGGGAFHYRGDPVAEHVDVRRDPADPSHHVLITSDAAEFTPGPGCSATAEPQVVRCEIGPLNPLAANAVFLGDGPDVATVDPSIVRLTVQGEAGGDILVSDGAVWPAGMQAHVDELATLAQRSGDPLVVDSANRTSVQLGSVVTPWRNAVAAAQRISIPALPNDEPLATDLRLEGGVGDDVIVDGPAASTATLGDGADIAFGGKGDDDVLVAGSGADVLVPGKGADTVDGFGTFVVDYVDHDGPITVDLNTPGGDGESGENDNIINRVAAGVIGGRSENVLLGDGYQNLFVGGPSNDVVRGGGRPDLMFGVAGNDDLDGGIGSDYLVNGTGSDRLSGGTGDGSNAVDTISYATHTAGVTVDLTKTAAGVDGEDELTSFEDAVGGEGDDVLRSRSYSSNPDLRWTLDGRGGFDTLYGGAGYDRLIGGHGADYISAAESGTQYSDEVDCGNGAPDAATLDALDVADGCEVVERR